MVAHISMPANSITVFPSAFQISIQVMFAVVVAGYFLVVDHLVSMRKRLHVIVPPSVFELHRIVCSNPRRLASRDNHTPLSALSAGA
jgi:hypothetical protein